MILALLFTVQQLQCPRLATDTTALVPVQVERRAIPDSTNAAPPYPGLLRQAGVGGPVRASFVVDTSGTPERASIEVLRSPHQGFDALVKRAIASWHFAPARACGRPARVRLVHEFLFVPGSSDTALLATVFLVDTAVKATRETLPDGTTRTTLAWAPTGLVISEIAWDSARGDSAEEAVLSRLIAAIPPTEDGTVRIICLFGPPGRADADPAGGRLSRLTKPGVAVLPYRRCPSTYASMMRLPDQRPDPPGDDPYHLRVLARRAIASDRMVFDVDVAHGTGGTHYKCGAERREGGWKATCRFTSSWVS